MTLPTQSTQPSSVQSQHFLLKWNNHRSNMVNVFESLLQSENLVDVTIAVEGKFIKAHKIVLSACSPYFQAMFVNQAPSERYPVLIFHDMKHAHLKTLLDFMYRGEISIDEKDLGEVLKVAEALSIRGLSSFESDDEEDKPEGQNNSNNNNNSNNQNANLSNNNANSNNSSSHHANNGTNSNGNHQQGAMNSNNVSHHNVNNGLHDNVASITTDQCTNGRGDNVSSSPNVINISNNSNATNNVATSTTTSSIYSSPTGRNHTNHGKQKESSSGGSNKKQKRGGGERRREPDYVVENDIEIPDISTIAQQLDRAVVESKIFEKKHNTHQSTLLKNQQHKARSISPPVKKKRGRPKSKPDVIPPPTNVTHSKIQTPSSSKLVHSSTEVNKRGSLATPVVAAATTGRQGVRRRLPRRFSGVPTRLKRVKLNKSGNSGGTGNGGGSGAGFGDDGGPLLDDGILFDPNGGDCEPLSEMSVRGLDLFKYASVEDGLYRCIECEKLSIPKTFKNKYSFQRHAFLYHEGNMRKVFPCPVCSREFSRPDKMKNHMKGVHEGGGASSGSSKGKGTSSNSEVSRDEEETSSAEMHIKNEDENSDGAEMSDEDADDRDDESCDYEVELQ